MRLIDGAQQAVGVPYAQNVWARRVQNIQNAPLRQYVQWQFQWSDSTGGGCEDGEVRRKYVIPGFSSFISFSEGAVRMAPGKLSKGEWLK